VTDHFKDPFLSRELYKHSKKALGNFRTGIDFTFFCDAAEKILNLSNEGMKRFLLKLLDRNEDGKVCESDIFSVMEKVGNEGFFRYLKEDIGVVVKELARKRRAMDIEDSHRHELELVRRKVVKAKEEKAV